MNRTCFLLLIFLINAFRLSSQISEGGLPDSRYLKQLKGTASIPEYRLKSFNRSALLQEDSLHPSPYRYAIFEDVNLDLTVVGIKDTLPHRTGFIWRLMLESDSAFSIQVILHKFIIPEGAKLFVYNEGLSQIVGGFTRNAMQMDSTLVLPDIVGNKAVIEYFEPENAAFRGQIIIGSVSKSYRNIYQVKSGNSLININCSEGRNLQLPKHAVCRITFRSGMSSYICSGALINNVRNNGTPYFLTASHCINDSAEASTLVAYFNYENEGCNGKAMEPRTLSGAKLLSTSPASDYSLLLLKSLPPSAYQPFYAGWDASDVAANHVAGIHHPEGLTKKLSIDNDSIVPNTEKILWDGNSTSPVSSHWRVNFDEGLTAGGSSGSPLFNKKHQIIGQLHGGDNTYDLYGKFSYSWVHTSGKYPVLKQFLDPDNTGKMTLDGYSPPSNPPDAFIDIPVSKVCLEAPVKLTDYSAFAPYTRTWIITPATFSFTDGTSQASANPVVEFLQPGFYSVSLSISNSAGTDSMRLSNAFQAGDSITTVISSSPPGEACLCNFDHFLAWASGAASYQWNILSGSDDKVELNHDSGDTVLVSRVTAFQADSSLTVNVRVTGTHGTCTDTAVLHYNLLKPINDNVKNARLLQYGESAIFSNKCATTETGEPVPPHYSCTTQYSWCDEYGTGENIVENSLWFKFVAGESGYISISSSGFDDEIALYDAANDTDIVSNHFTILAANDDRSTSDYNPIIRSQQLTPGKTYWLQVDGSGGGLEGNFKLQLTALTVTALTPENKNVLVVYPQPAKNMVYIEGGLLTALPVHITIFSITGRLILNETVHPDGKTIPVNVSSWENGVYVAKIESGNTRFVTRIIKF